MRVLTLLALSVALFGCDIGGSTMHDAKREYVCRDKGGVYDHGFMLSKAVCRNGEFIDRWWDAVLPPEYYPSARQRNLDQ